MSDHFRKKMTVAIKINYLDGVRQCLLEGADENMAREDGTTILMVAVRHARQEIVSTLLAAGANPKAANEDGKTAWAIAKEKGLHDISEILRKAGA